MQKLTFVPIAGILNLLMYSLPNESWRDSLLIWTALGAVIYFVLRKEKTVNNQTNVLVQTKGIIVF
jgi:hypothetical protein